MIHQNSCRGRNRELKMVRGGKKAILVEMLFSHQCSPGPWPASFQSRSSVLDVPITESMARLSAVLTVHTHKRICHCIRPQHTTGHPLETYKYFLGWIRKEEKMPKIVPYQQMCAPLKCRGVPFTSKWLSLWFKQTVYHTYHWWQR